ncbi:hypothetical protein [Heyndrickxia oleronia]
MKNPFHHLARAVFINENKILLAQAKGIQTPSSLVVMSNLEKVPKKL